MKDEIILDSRYGVKNKLVRIEEDSLKYKLETPYNYRIGYDKNPETPTFIDPSGGPFITVGTEIDGHIVKALYEGCIIEFES